MAKGAVVSIIVTSLIELQLIADCYLLHLEATVVRGGFARFGPSKTWKNVMLKKFVSGVMLPSYWRLIISAAAILLTVNVCLATTQKSLPYVGVNLADASFGSKRFPGELGTDFIYPKEDDIDYFLDRGFNTFRLTFRWERLQLNLGWELEATQLAQMDDVIDYVTANNGYVILDPHNYARYFGKLIGSEYVPVSAFTYLWSELAEHYRDNEHVIFGLMNEPHGIRADDWRESVDAAIHAIRATGAKNLILVPGTNWSGAGSWSEAQSGVSNASAFQSLTDPADNVAFEVHQYFDDNSSGTSPICERETIGVERLEPFTQWLRENKRLGFLGEFGAADNSVCLAALENALNHIAENSDVWIGWTYWAAGAWWGDYMFSIHPSPDGEQGQMKVLMKAVSD